MLQEIIKPKLQKPKSLRKLNQAGKSQKHKSILFLGPPNFSKLVLRISETEKDKNKTKLKIQRKNKED